MATLAYLLVAAAGATLCHGAQLVGETWQWLGKQGAPTIAEDLPCPAQQNGTTRRFYATFNGALASLAEGGRELATRIRIPNVGISAEVGQPELPVYRRVLAVIPKATVACQATVQVQKTFVLGEAGLPRVLTQRHRPVPKVPGALQQIKAAAEAEERTQRGAELPVARLIELGIQRGQRIVLLEVFPISYDPTNGAVILREAIELEIRTQSISDDALLAQSSPPAAATLNTDSNGGTPPRRLLIITSAPLAESLTAFIEHKTALSWAVDCFTTDLTGNTAESIRAFIRSRYVSETTRPSHLLLVGDTDTIPAWRGRGAYLPDTDLYYACMDGTNDWLPDLSVGRFPARTAQQLTNMLARSVYYETNVTTLNPFVSRAVFVASEDNYALTENTHNYVIGQHLDPRGYLAQRLYRHTYSATTGQVTDAINAGCSLLAYSGHGNALGWLDPALSVTDVWVLGNNFRCPLVMSFACDTGSFRTYDECFAEAWLRATGNAGAVAVLAASEDTYWEEDDVFQKCVFAAIFEDNFTRIGDAVEAAKLRYLVYYGTSSETLQYFEQYNLFGDPSLRLVVMDASNLTGPMLSAQGFLPDGSFQFAVSGVTAQTYAVQTSSNLVDWTPWRNVLTTNSVMYFRDHAATNSAQRFYRVVVP